MRTSYLYILYILCFFMLLISACENPVEIGNVQTRQEHTEITVLVSPENSGRVEITPVKNYYRVGEHITVRATSSKDFHFLSWIDLPSGQQAEMDSEEITLVVMQDQDLHAEFQKNPGISTVVDPEGAGRIIIEPAVEFYPPNTEIRLSAAAEEGFFFSHWLEHEGAGADLHTAIEREPLHFTAVFTSEPTLTVQNLPEEAGQIYQYPGGLQHSPGTVISLRAEAAEQYYFTHWICTTEPDIPLSTEKEISITLNNTRYITAVFQRYSLLETQVVPPGSGVIQFEPEGSLFEPGTLVHARADATHGYFFSSWSGPVSSLNDSVDFEVPSADSILTAYFSAEPEIHIFAEPPYGGTFSVSPQGSSFAPGTELSFSAAASPDFIFSHWNINDEVFSETDLVFIIENTIHAKAVFIPRRKTIFIYMAADNELESYALQDLNRLEQHNIEAKGISVLILLDRPSGAGLYQLQPDPLGYHPAIASRQLDSPELGLSSQQLHPINMGSPETLRAFIREGLNRFPAEQYSIIIWGHGSGWRSQDDPADPTADPMGTALFRATAYDDGSGDALYTLELATGLSEIHRVDPELSWTLIGLEVCKGMMMEVLYELRGLSSFVAGSPDVIPAAGWDYGLIASGLISLDHTQQDAFGNLLTDSFAAAYGGTAKAAFSVIYLDKIHELHSAWNLFSIAMKDYAAVEAQRQNLLRVLFHEVQDYYLVPGDLNIDMGHAATVIASEIPELFSAAVEFLDIYQSSVFRLFSSGIANSNASGIAIHLVPLNEYGTATLPHASAYFTDGQVSHALDFMKDSLWPPDSQGGGLLGRLWYGE
ncbi:clostripain-related cysteine peptidase [Spirochaeta dissipatitropha]